jgi:hypothetical protein
MNRTWIHYEICTEDKYRFYPFGHQYSTMLEAEAALKLYLHEYPTAFIMFVEMTRCGERVPHRSLQLV